MKRSVASTVIPGLLIFFIINGCTRTDPNQSSIDSNPASTGFNENGSDAQAVAIANKVMEAMGGRKNWDNTRVICWEFFGRRHLIWDKWTGDVRIDSYPDSTKYILNINSMEGMVQIKGNEITQPDSLKNMLERGKRIWINDSYWLVMPYKLKDSGVTLKYLREDTTAAGIKSDVLQLTFENVGVTPDNKYEVWVDKESSLVRQWAYYQYDTLQEPGFVLPWNNWEKHGNIMLSGNRGERTLGKIQVLDECPESTFTSFEPVSLSQDD